MQYLKYIASSLLLSAALLLLPAARASAATLSLLPSATSFKIGDQFTVDMQIDSGGTNINAAQATVDFPAGMLRLVSVSKAQSVFNFWVQEPTFSNDAGTMQFIAGTSSGISGNALEVLQMTFQTTGAGTAAISLSDPTVTANDGKGTNVLSNVQGASVTISTSVSSAPSPSPAASTAPTAPAPAPVVLPQPVVRTAAPAKGLPDAPTITVSLYPDQSRWSNLIGDAIALWNVPADVTAVTTSVDQNPNGVPSTANAEPTLVNGKDFGSLKEGIRYIHARFKNALGWGKTATYKISLDLTPPLPFTIGIDNAKSDNPAPQITFQTQDSLSGIDHALIFLDGNDPLTSTSTSMTLAPQTPGSHALAVRIFDKAGNSIGSDLTFEIVPLPEPTIDVLDATLTPGDDRIGVKGTALLHASLLLSLKRNSDGTAIYRDTLSVDEKGVWTTTILHAMPRGEYYIEVQAKDARSALSFPVRSVMISVQEPPLLVIGGIGITQGWFFAGLILLLLIGMAMGWLMSRAWSSRVHSKAVVTERDFYNSVTKISKDIDMVQKRLEGKDEHGKMRTEAQYYAKHAQGGLRDLEKYLADEIEDIPK